MNDILATIAATKLREVEAMKRLIPAELLTEAIATTRRHTLSLSRSVITTDGGIIAEHKRRSPSKGEISPMSEVADVVASYSHGGAAGISVLTDAPYFGGQLTDLAVARSATDSTPLLRKDFMVDPYQLLQARALGADAVLLIAALLTPAEIASMADEAHRLGLEVLLELHNADEAHRSPLSAADLVGVNNRDLRSFATSLEASVSLAELLPKDVVKIAESGIRSASDINMLRQAGFNGFLIGETLMSTSDPGATLKSLIDESR